VSLPGWGKLSSQNLADSVRSVASTGVPLSRFIYSLGIPQIGTHASQLVASVYGNVESFLKAVEEASHCNTDVSNIDEVGIENPMPPFPALTGWDGFDKVKGIGPTAIASLVAFSREQVLVNEAKELASVLTIHDNRSRNTSDANTSDRHAEGSQKQKPFDGMTVVFTGALPGMSREMAQNAAKDLGAKATPTAVSKATSLVVDGKEGTSNKARKARELGIRVIDYTEFMRLIDASN
jgi:DNA ligase (NAD+)